MKKYFIFFFFGLFLLNACSESKDKPSQWRGPDRQGIFYETGLLKTWPENGPELLWSFEGLGAGHSSVGIGNDRVFINGMPDTLGVLYSFDLDGNLLWEKVYGEEWHESYTGSRSTPLVVDDVVYLESGMGVVYCLNALSGEIIWEVDLPNKFDGQNIQWGMTESLLIDGDQLICTPGGEVNNMVALNRHSGETIWTSPGFKEQSAYCSPVLVVHNNTRLVVTMTSTSVIGIDADTGEFYWREEQLQGNLIHANSPVYSDGVIYFSSSSAKQNCGLLALKLSEDGKSVSQLWRNENFRNLMGGIVIKDGFIYGGKYRKKEWYSINKNSGEETLISEEFDTGVIVSADSLFYCYNEKGQVALVDIGPNKFEIKSSFDVPLGTDQHWAHPVIHNKRMYIRHGNALMVYNISR
ncbi:MAG: PQQ-binding-like beta-propeller repeat protein [Prolixibacteraceae bacterium]|jgi:outer membrane protein assembly factor BamB|nr:PQQ-binding-like beta-propeller repeat protein [Prolixibacteraceae bacterium]MBT6004499.1 PQQ-binding-like beta-propeller repeat protein [Prolixibacteraceae bacterium]MBT6764385.1 PQQ-binding-like beta-propeller repeat protein [Prolixibacteraceae bacterium]MBT6999421.1 PQQ-binding-like beta-propeller repeat protein [Prolixibacteraceae bacterium]MBT7394315.1 PQQ-binding-like beta-propeller repeat protein [Prolixibacteraceae bacterium]